MIQGAKPLDIGLIIAEYYAYNVAIPYFSDLISQNVGSINTINQNLRDTAQAKSPENEDQCHSENMAAILKIVNNDGKDEKENVNDSLGETDETTEKEGGSILYKLKQATIRVSNGICTLFY